MYTHMGYTWPHLYKTEYNDTIRSSRHPLWMESQKHQYRSFELIIRNAEEIKSPSHTISLIWFDFFQTNSHIHEYEFYRDVKLPGITQKAQVFISIAVPVKAIQDGYNDRWTINTSKIYRLFRHNTNTHKKWHIYSYK